jgi:hypothetical protein
MPLQRGCAFSHTMRPGFTVTRQWIQSSNEPKPMQASLLRR